MNYDYDEATEKLHEVVDRAKGLETKVMEQAKELRRVRRACEESVQTEKEKVGRLRRRLVGFRRDSRAWREALPEGVADQLEAGAVILDRVNGRVNGFVDEEEAEEVEQLSRLLSELAGKVREIHSEDAP